MARRAKGISARIRLARAMRDQRIDVVFKRAREGLRRAPSACWQDGGSGKERRRRPACQEEKQLGGRGLRMRMCVLGEGSIANPF